MCLRPLNCGLLHNKMLNLSDRFSVSYERRREKSMFEIIIIVLSIIYLVLNLFVSFGILLQVDDDNSKTGALIGIKEFFDELFYNRNIFGIFISSIFLVLVIPAIILVLGTQIIFWIGMILGYIYNLGNRKDR